VGDLIDRRCKQCKSPLSKWTSTDKKKGIACLNMGCPKYAIIIKRKRVTKNDS
jgi:hypothetical protein